MSDMPARTFSEASRSQQGQSQRFSASKSWHQQHESGSPSFSKRMAAAGPSSPRSPPKRPWDSPPDRQTVASFGHDSAEEDELSDEIPPHIRDDRSPRPQRTLSTKRKTNKGVTQASSPKRSKRAAADLSPTAKNTDASYHADTHSQGSSPRGRLHAASVSRSEESAATGSSARLLSVDEIDTFLDLIYKHHPEPMTAENMRQSVDALYRDWEQYCARRQMPVRLAKKPLMDEYGKIFNGVYGSDAQTKARSIAHELSQRSANVSASKDFAHEEQDPRRGSGSRRSLTRSMSDADTNDDEDDEDDNEDADDADQDEGATGGDGGSSSAPLLASRRKTEKGPDTSEVNPPESSSTKKSNIAQVGRNGLAVLPPGLFDILRSHLRDDILSSIMPSVRNDLTEQTRELFLQNQDLFGRIKEMEDRIRNQDLWIRHLLSRDPSDMTTPPVGPHANATGMPGPDPKSNGYPASARDAAHFGRPPRQGPLGSDTEMGPSVAIGDYFDSSGPMSPRQHPRNEARRVPPPGAAGPLPFEGRMPSAGASSGMHPGPGFAPPGAFGPGRWEAEGQPPGAYRDRPPQERRPSYANEPPHRRPGSWQGEMQPGRDPRIHAHPSERHEQLEARYEPPLGPQHGQHRLSVSEARRLSTYGGGGSSMGPCVAPRGPSGPLPPSAGHVPSTGSMHDDFRRPGGSMYSREPGMPPNEPAYEARRMHAHPGMPASSQSDPYFGSADQTKAPLPPRAMAAASPEQVRNKRGRPSKAELASSSGSSSHPSAPSRPYLS